MCVDPSIRFKFNLRFQCHYVPGDRFQHQKGILKKTHLWQDNVWSGGNVGKEILGEKEAKNTINDNFILLQIDFARLVSLYDLVSLHKSKTQFFICFTILNSFVRVRYNEN